MIAPFKCAVLQRHLWSSCLLSASNQTCLLQVKNGYFPAEELQLLHFILCCFRWPGNLMLCSVAWQTAGLVLGRFYMHLVDPRWPAWS